MNAKNKFMIRWRLLAVYLGMVTVLLACTITGGGTQLNTDDALLRLEDGVIEVQDESGDWVPAAGESTFEMIGELQSTEPWAVAGTTFETRESTRIEEGLAAGDLVKVRGVILEDDTWVAYSIERVEEQTNPTIILIGQVTSIDPWVVNGITLNVTEDTVITGEIIPGMIVHVEILLLEDGTWEVIGIAPLGDFTETPGCATVVATVVSVNGNEIQFLGWPTTVTLGDASQTEDENDTDDGEDQDNGNENEDNDEEGGGVTVSPGQTVLAVVCVSENGQLVIVQITILDADDDDTSEGVEKVLVCHKPDKRGGHTISIAAPAVPAHLGHGDTLGPCP
jgi:hypothetical protein